MEKISNDYRENVRVLDGLLGVGRSCDMVCRDLYVGGRRARFWVIDGFGGDAILERMGAFWLSLQPEAVQGLIDVALLRNMAAAAGIYEVKQQQDSLLLYQRKLDLEVGARMSAAMKGRDRPTKDSSAPV